ncbi:DUF937 domain-containing protein [Alcaligenaceae bacterium]|nr:DUF937 domain-containing protein [Alcaligenaceae bacterium]
MGLLNSIVSAMGERNPELGAQARLLPVLIEQVNRFPGGLPGLIEKFQQAGLGGVVASWIREGRNEPISPDQLHSALGDDIVNDLARSSGLDVGAVLGNLSIMLPSLVDQATPDGETGLQRVLGGVTNLFGAQRGQTPDGV